MGYLIFPWGASLAPYNLDLANGGLLKSYFVGDEVFTNMRNRPQDRYVVVKMESRPTYEYNLYSISSPDATTSGLAVWVKPIDDARPVPPDGGNNEPSCGGWFWPTLRDARYPHNCPKCGSPAFIGFLQIDCSKRCH